jgi:hypothetical protein
MFPINAYWGDALILIAFATVFIVVTIKWKPRMWLHDFPADIQALAAPKTPEEKRFTTLVGMPFVLVFFALNVALTWDIKAAMGAEFTFGAAWLYAYALFMGFNLWDWLVLDWIGLSLVDPQHPPFPGTEGAAGWRDYRFHFYGFLKGCVIGLIFAVVVAALVTFLA